MKEHIEAGKEMPVPKRSLRNRLYNILFPLALISAPIAYVTLLKILFNDDVKETRTNSSYEQADTGNHVLGALEAATFYYNIFGLRGIENLSSDEIVQRIRDYNP